MAPAQSTANTDKVVSNIAKLDAEHPIPVEKKGLSHIADKNHRYIPFIGDNDDFFEVLAEARTNSPTCNACVTTKVGYSVGSGWTFGDDKLNQAFLKEFKYMNKKRQTLNKILRLVFDNGYTSGNCFINIVRGSVGSKKFIRTYVKSNYDSRLAYSDDHDVSDKVIFSSRFRQETGYITLGEKQQEIPIYNGEPNQKWYKDDKGLEHICLHIKNEVSSHDHYGLPVNVASLIQQLNEYKGARYNLDNFENNLVIGGMIFLNSSMSSEEATKHAKKIVKTQRGDGNTGRWMIFASENEVKDVKVEPFQTQKDGSYIELSDKAQADIIIANQWHPILAGIEKTGSMGRGKGYFREIFEQYYNGVIRPEQERVIEEFLNNLLEIIRNWCGARPWDGAEMDIKTPVPVSYGSDIDINSIMTVDEGREVLKMDPLEGELGGKIISTNAKPKDNVPNK